MTMVKAIPSPAGGSINLPHYNWAPDIIENMEEGERRAYLEMLRANRKAVLGK